jgi:hypothetical protein
MIDTNIQILKNRLNQIPEDRIVLLYSHDIETCGKYSASLIDLIPPYNMSNLSEQLTGLEKTTTKRCIFCKKFIKAYSYHPKHKFLIKKDVILFLESETNLY